jgi:site-specific DNA recombinase
MLAIYTRLSRDEKQSHSIENQKDLGILYAKEHNLEYKIYVDNGISGTLSTIERPDFEILMTNISEGLITKVWVSRQDRLERNPDVWFFAVKIFKKNRVELIFGDKGNFDYNNVDKMFEGSLMSIINKKYVDTLAQASKKQIRRNIEKGYSHGRPAYGFKKGEDRRLIIDEEEKKVIESIYEMSLRGIGTNTIAKTLEEKKILTSYNKIGEGTYFHKDQFGKETVFNKSDVKWNPNTIRSIIKNPIYKGQRIWKGETFEVEKIFQNDYWELVNKNLPNNRNNSGKKVHHQYLLKGLLKCHKCDRNMNGKKRIDKSDNFYYCASKRITNGGCGNKSINIDAIEGIIWSLFFKEGHLMNFLKDELVKDEEDLSKILKKISECEQRIKNLFNQRTRFLNLIKSGGIEDESIIMSELNSISTQIKEENYKISDFEIQIANAKKSKDLLKNHHDDFKKYTENLTFLEKQEVIKKYIYQIRVIFNEKNSIAEFANSYSIVIKFKFKKEDENFVFLRNDNLLYSINRGTFIFSKFLNTSNSNEYLEEDVQTLIKNTLVNLPKIGTVQKPFIEKGTKSISILNNTIIPFGNIKDWNSKTIIGFYQKFPEYLDNDIGVSVLSLNKNNFNKKMANTYSKHFNEGGTLETWVEEICKVQKIKN